jgi:hypothetical protein
MGHFSFPVDEHAVRGDYQEVTFAHGVQVAHRRQGLHSLAEAHVISEQGALLMDHELGSEHLVASEVGLQRSAL